MNFIVSSSELLRHVGTVVGVVPAKSVLPIVQNILFDIRDTVLELTATDLENSMRTSLSIESQGGKILIALPARLLVDTLKALPEQPLTISIHEESFKVDITTENGRYSLNGQNGADFPKINIADDTTSITMPLPVLIKSIQKTIFAASTDEMKLAMSGVYFDFRKTGATIVATDAHRLVQYSRSDVSVEQEINFILPQKALRLLTTAAGNSLEPVRIDYNTSNAFFRFGSTLLICRLIDAKYPDYRGVIPASSPNRAILTKKELLAALKRMDIYSNKSTHLGRFKLNGNLLVLRAEDIEFANEAKENLSCMYEGEDMEIGFNLSLMTDVIANIETEELVIELGSPGRAAVIKPSTQEEHENLLMLVMPIMIANYN
ncbi:MAG: DNA polymerase III subunit beta [Bacteroidia bacterium]|nr:DNA polymerase III subunit beta [Bacteroidia bacterium]